MAVWASKLDRMQMKKAVVSDVELTHPNLLVQDAVFVYCATIAHILNLDQIDRNSGEDAVYYALDLC